MLRKNFIIIVICSVFAGIFLSFFFLANHYSPRTIAAKVANKVFQEKEVKDNDPAVVLEKYFKAWESVNPAEMYRYISTYDKENVSLRDYEQGFMDVPIRPLAHKIKKVDKSRGSARITVLVSWPDLSAGKKVDAEEIFYMIEEGDSWKIREASSL